MSKNSYVKTISERGIIYTDEFKRKFISEYEQGNSSVKTFENQGFDVDILGKKRIISSGEVVILQRSFHLV